MSRPLSASFQGFLDLFSPMLSRLLMASAMIAASLLAVGVWSVMRFVVPIIPDWGGQFGNVAEATASGLAIFVTFVVALILWPLVAMIVSGLFADVAANRLEEKLLPVHRRGIPPSMISGLLAGLRFATVSIPLNLLAIPLYFIPGVNLVVAIALNAFLLSRENYILADLRYVSFPDAQRDLRSHRGGALLAALPGAIFTIIPFVGFIVPLWTLATMVRLRADYHSQTQNGGTP